MKRILRTTLAAVLLVSLLAGGAGTVAAGSSATYICDSDTTIINDHDLVDLDDNLNNISVNVGGSQTDDGLTLLS